MGIYQALICATIRHSSYEYTEPAVNVIVINSSKAKPLEILRKLHDVKIYAITTSKYKNLYIQGEEVEVVDDYTDYSTVIAASRRIMQRAEIHAVLAPTESTVPLGG